MSRAKILYLMDCLPRSLSLLGFLGLIGVGGLVEPDLYRFSALSFLSYISFFRNFRRFIDPNYGLTNAAVPFIVLALLAGAIFPGLVSMSPMAGFIGFAGCCGLYDPRYNVTHSAI